MVIRKKNLHKIFIFIEVYFLFSYFKGFS